MAEMMKRFTRLLAVLLALTMLLSCAAFAETTQATAQPAENAGNYSQSDKDSLAALSAALSDDTAAAKPAADAEAPALPADGTYVPGELLVKVRRSASLQSAESMFGQFAESTENLMSVPERADGAALASDETAMDDWYTLALKQGTDMLTAWKGILGMTGVLYVQPNYIYHTESSTADVTENDPYMHSQTWLDQIEAPDAWGEVSGNPGNGVVVAPDALLREITKLEEKGVPVRERLRISPSCPLILSFHVALDQAREKARGELKIGTTGRGIGPAYEDKVARRGLRVGDLLNMPRFEEKLRELVEYHNFMLVGYYKEPAIEFEKTLAECKEYAELLKPLMLDVTAELHDLRRRDAQDR